MRVLAALSAIREMPPRELKPVHDLQRHWDERSQVLAVLMELHADPGSLFRPRHLTWCRTSPGCFLGEYCYTLFPEAL